MTVRTRLAPTPSGFLHVGNAVNFVVTWARARMASGEVMLRIDDIDSTRVREAYLADVFETLHWLRLDWDIGPRTIEEFHERWSQRHRLVQYNQVLQELRDANALFACTCSRAQLRAEGNGLRYAGTCLHAGHSLDAPNVSWRLLTPQDIALPFAVVRQKEGTPAYNLVSVVDDVTFGITHIMRGDDLIPATEVQQYLGTCAPSLAPFDNIQIEHHPLLTDKEGRKLSKSQGAWELRHIRASGGTPFGVYELAARMLNIGVHQLTALTADR